jgi:hypothetical protein
VTHFALLLNMLTTRRLRLASVTLASMVALSLASSCAENLGDISYNYSPPLNSSYPTHQSKSEVQRALEIAPLSCDLGDGACKAAFGTVGLVAMATEGDPSSTYTLGQCTGFLYGANNIVALNSHCITDNIWNNRADCGKYLGIKFVEGSVTRATNSVRMCKELLFRSPLKRGNAAGEPVQDFAFFRIDPYDVKPMKISDKMSLNNSTVQLNKINPIGKDSLGGVATISRCETRLKSDLNQKYTTQWYETGLAVEKRVADLSSPCLVIPGNSGSPVINESGEVIGIAQAFTTSLTAAFKSDLVERRWPERIPGHFHFTQVNCIVAPLSNPGRNPSCGYWESAPAQTLPSFNILDSVKTDDMLDVAVLLTKSHPSIFKFAAPTTNGILHTSNIDCVRPFKIWDKSRYDITSTGFFSKTHQVSVPSIVTAVKLKPIMNYTYDFVFQDLTFSNEKEISAYEVTAAGDQISIRKQVVINISSSKSAMDHFRDTFRSGLFGPREEILESHWCEEEK